MAKVKTLEKNELDALRDRVKATYKTNCPNNELNETTFKGAYDELRADILRFVPSFESSVSTQRLRKLFYYTNPTLCAEDKLEPPSFGKDFLEAIEMYTGRDNPITTPSPIPTKKPLLSRLHRSNLWALASVALVVALVNLVMLLLPTKLTGWREEFGDNSVAALKQRGWEILDYDSAWFSKKLQDTGALTLYTLRGDYWVKPHEKPVIPNLMVKELGFENCNILAKLSDFIPMESHQQAGIFLLDRKMSRTHNVRFTYECASCNQPKREKVRLVSITKNESGVVTLNHPPLVIGPHNFGEGKFLFLYLEIRGRNVKFYFHTGEDWGHNVKIEELQLTYQPKYIALAAFHGFTWDDGTPKNAAAIPVNFDYVKVEAVESN